MILRRVGSFFYGLLAIGLWLLTIAIDI